MRSRNRDNSGKNQRIKKAEIVLFTVITIIVASLPGIFLGYYAGSQKFAADRDIKVLEPRKNIENM